MRKINTFIISCLLMVSFIGCNFLDIDPVSSITDQNYWKSKPQFEAFNTGTHGLFRELSYNFFLLGEARSNIYGDQPFGGEATQGIERLPYNTLNRENTVISNFAGMYRVINQINLMIAKTSDTEILTESEKNYYLGQAYGMRAYLYFQLLRSWGNVIIHTTYTEGSSLDLANLAKEASSVTEVMNLIKADLEASENAFGNDMTYKFGKQYWSKPATLILKGEVYLWSGNQMGGGDADYKAAQSALEIVRQSSLTLQSDFERVFAYDNKKNDEIIFTIHNGKDEYSMWNDAYRANLIPQQVYIGLYYNEDFISFTQLPDAQFNGLIRLQPRYDLYQKVFRDSDTRKRASLRAVYKKEEDNTFTYLAPFAYKFQGVLLEGQSQRSFLDDFPIYRYADCLLLLAEAKVFLGEDPSAEINQIRERAYGKDFFDANRATLAYPNDNGDFYSDNNYVGEDNDAMEAVLKERLREFMFEGKRWYDLRLAGAEYVTRYSSADPSRLLWPINESTLTDNPKLEQTTGY